MRIVVCAVLGLAAAAGAGATDAPANRAATAAAGSATDTRSTDLLELDEVIVRGKRITEAIADAEDEFYQLFNKLNKDDDYDTRCVNLNVDTYNRGSLLTTRMCIPGFLADAMADTAQWKVRCAPEFVNYDTNRDGRISEWEAGQNSDLVVRFAEIDTDESHSLDELEFRPWADQTTMSSNCYQPPPPELVLAGRSQAWFDHSMQVIRSDPRLQEMAGHLDDLYHEWAEVQGRYGSIKGANKAPPTERRELGPRGR